MKPLLNTICSALAWLVICFGCGFIGWLVPRPQLSITEQSIPTIPELQQALIDTNQPRYDVGTDGADGIAGPNTLTAWGNWTFDNYVEVYYTNSGAAR